MHINEEPKPDHVMGLQANSCLDELIDFAEVILFCSKIKQYKTMFMKEENL